MGKIIIKEEKSFFNEQIINSKMAAGYSVMLMKGGEILLELHEGADSFEKHRAIPYSSNTLFNLASSTKPFTSALILKLQEDGLLSTEDRVQKFILEYPFDDVKLSHLMLHTSGYGADAITKLIHNSDRTDIKKYLQAIYAMDKRDHPLGTQCIYFSAGYTILLDIIERITGLSMDTFAKKVLFDPLNMQNTTYDISTINLSRYPCPTSFSEDGEVVAEKNKNYSPLGEGGMISNCREVLRFGEMILNKGTLEGKKVLDEKTVDIMLTEATNGMFNRTLAFACRGVGETYPTCFSDDYSPKASGHPGFSGTMFWVEPELNMTAVFLSNSITIGGEWFTGPGNLMWRIAQRLRELTQ